MTVAKRLAAPVVAIGLAAAVLAAYGASETEAANKRADVLAEACGEAPAQLFDLCLGSVSARHDASLLAVATGFAALAAAAALVVGFALRQPRRPARSRRPLDEYDEWRDQTPPPNFKPE